eukprot:Hpha_TRINITY_DN35647_c0_g1::TRINITY_DN35647_c0_g1_i1::g.68523::m.68523
MAPKRIPTLEHLIFRTSTVSYVIGGGMFAYASWNTYRWYQSKEWYRVDGRILAMYPYRAWLGDEKHRYHVDYTFEYEGENYFGVCVQSGTMWRWWMGDFCRDSAGQNEINRCRMRPGATVKVLMNPNDPTDSALLRLPDSFRNGAMMGVGATLCFCAAWVLPPAHRLPILDKMRWVWRRRMQTDVRKTRVIDVVFDRDPETQAWRHPQESGWKPDEKRRSRLGLNAEDWDADVRQVTQRRQAKEREKSE